MRMQTRRVRQATKHSAPVATAVFRGGPVEGEAVASNHPSGRGTLLRVHFTKVPKGEHGFHIHRAGDLRGEGCKGACDHFHVGRPCRHGSAPTSHTRKARHSGEHSVEHSARQSARHFCHSSSKELERHSGDLGNIPSASPTHPFCRSYHLAEFPPHVLWGRSLIVHADKDDLGKGSHEDSGTTGHSGTRIGCAIFGRASGCV
jgi:Cu-Zn family superoxide dismutase